MGSEEWFYCLKLFKFGSLDERISDLEFFLIAGSEVESASVFFRQSVTLAEGVITFALEAQQADFACAIPAFRVISL
jgi:hypothetical protein